MALVQCFVLKLVAAEDDACMVHNIRLVSTAVRVTGGGRSCLLLGSSKIDEMAEGRRGGYRMEQTWEGGSDEPHTGPIRPWVGAKGTMHAGCVGCVKVTNAEWRRGGGQQLWTGGEGEQSRTSV